MGDPDDGSSDEDHSVSGTIELGIITDTADEQTIGLTRSLLKHREGDHSEASATATDHSATDPITVVPSTPSKEKTEESSLRKSVWKLAFGAIGIYASYLYHGNLEEDLFRYRNDEDGRKFTYCWLLQVLESTAAITVGFFGRLLCSRRDGSQATMKKFFLPGASQLFAKAFSSLALSASVAYPVVVLAKSAKIAPVMLGQLCLGGSSYSIRDYSFVLLVVCGTTLLSSGGADESLENEMTTFTGLFFILASLTMDGVTAGLQKRLQRQTKSNPPTSYDFLVFTNLSMIGIASVIAILTGEFIDGHRFFVENPRTRQMVMRCCMCSAIGQSFIFFIITSFDPLVLSTVTTSRKIISVLISVIAKGHQLSGRGVTGLTMALTGLLIEIYGKVKGSNKTHSR